MSETLIPISFKKDRKDGTESALCLDLTDKPQEDAPLVMIDNIDEKELKIFPYPYTFSQWLQSLQELAEEDIALRTVLSFDN